MKKYINQTVIEELATEYEIARLDLSIGLTSGSIERQKYFRGKLFGLVMSFAILTAQPFEAAERILLRRGMK